MSFEVSEKRFVVVKDDEIRLFEDGSNKVATFSYPRWAQFVEFFDEIDNAVNKLIREKKSSCACTSAHRGTCRWPPDTDASTSENTTWHKTALSNRQRPALRCDSTSGAACWRWSRTSRRNIPRSLKLSPAGLRLTILIRRVL
jgi:hypothetical protein